ncbi:hypothetical protein MKW98_016862 [Papaver atlanticum]|uniref:Rab-GAP TBC domain-containing protein n=1 Tax=Papaver atlanticum TaxID=357466 RepID=A0AAD4TJX5_9MAGN|nr:hypothetical protein MKW98_016862 [Papaver atlanticum]
MGCFEGGCMNPELGESDCFYEIRPEFVHDVPKTRFKPRVGKTLSMRKWNSAFTLDGHLDIAKVLNRIQRGGVHPSIKGAVWEFLLACYDPNSTFEERNQLRKHRREQYSNWKAECKNMEPMIGSGRYITMPIISEDGKPVQYPSNNNCDSDSEHNGAVAVLNAFPTKLDVNVTEVAVEKKVIQWKLGLHQIGLDVHRTDRTLVFYESAANLAKLWDILAVYAWMDKDIGYCQGMSDLCSPMVILVENEADAFWCFERLMRRVRGNYKCTKNSVGVQSQLSTLAEVLRVVDPKLHQHIEDLDGGQYLFAFRMLMVLFRREFSVVDAMHLWEMMWAMEYNPNTFSAYEELYEDTTKCRLPKENDMQLKRYGKFERKNVKAGSEDSLSIFLVASVLEARNKRFLREAKGLDDIIKILNDINGDIDAKEACKEALNVQKKYLRKIKKL